MFERGPLFIPRSTFGPPRSLETPPALGGRGMLVRAIGRFSGMRMLLLAAPRFGMFSAGLCVPLISGKLPWFRPTFRFPPIPSLRLGLGLPKLPWLRATGDCGLNAPREFCGAEARLTTGRAKLLEGLAADLPALGPSTAAFVGRTFTLMLFLMLLFTVILLIWFCDTRTLFLATLREFRIVSRETAVNPFRACRLA